MFLQELCKHYMPHLLQNMKCGISQRMMPVDLGVICLMFTVVNFLSFLRGETISFMFNHKGNLGL